MTELELMEAILTLSVDHSITAVKIVYEGSGDSGSIESIVCSTEPYETPQDIEDGLDVWAGDRIELDTLNSVLAQNFQDFAYEKLLANVEDWYNNEGGWGSICICIPSGEYNIFNNVRITESELFIHSGILNEQIEK